MKAYDIVDAFEGELGRYTGAPHVIAVESCTSALLLALLWFRRVSVDGCSIVRLPRRTYLGVAQSALNAGYAIEWSDEPWQREYRLDPLPLWDSAKLLERGMFVPGEMRCVSFHVAKRLPLGRGGAILTDDDQAAAWLRRARFDGRSAGETGEDATLVTRPGFHVHMTPPDAARGLWLLQQFLDRPLNDSSEHYPDVSEWL